MSQLEQQKLLWHEVMDRASVLYVPAVASGQCAWCWWSEEGREL